MCIKTPVRVNVRQQRRDAVAICVTICTSKRSKAHLATLVICSEFKAEAAMTRGNKGPIIDRIGRGGSKYYLHTKLVN